MARSNYVVVLMGIALLTGSVARAQEPEAECPPDVPDEDAPPSYGEQGVFELGGSIGGMWTEDVFTLNIAPSAGVFVIDYLELSLVLGLEYENVRGDDGTRSDGTTFAVLFEPSYHVPIVEDDLFLLGGLGLGVGYDGVTVGFDLVPRAGMNIALGAGRMLNPSIRVPIIMGTEVDDNGEEHFETSVSVGFDIGYSTVF